MDKSKAKRASSRLRRRTRRWLGSLAGLVVVASGIGYLGWTYGWSGVPGVGDPAPAYVLEAGDGRRVDLADYLGRQPVVLLFYMNYG